MLPRLGVGGDTGDRVPKVLKRALRRGQLVVGNMKKIRDLLNSIVVKSLKVFTKGMQGKAATKYQLTATFPNSYQDLLNQLAVALLKF